MAHILAQVRFTRTSQMAEDIIVNTFHFGTTNPTLTSGDATSISTAIQEFYKTGVGAASPLTTYMSNLIANSTDAHEIRMYNMNDLQPRPIRSSVKWSTPSLGGAPLPAEVALCLSFRGAPPGGQPVARSRGRIYFGPLSQSTVQTGNINGDARPSTVFQTALVAAGERLMNRPSTGPILMVFSPTGGFIIPVNRVWVDDAFDTQRRRGADPIGRLVRDAPQV